ncbi:MAG: hypothetical protein HY796_06360 [Elusimicrobia bacterium]|nr:hypothetical protein [Elusimicrobiota bacterium]
MRISGIFMITAAGCLLAALLTAAVHAKSGDAGKSLEILIETDGAKFTGLSKKVRAGKLPELHRQALRKGFYYIEALDASGRVLYVRTMPASNEVFYDYFDPAAQTVGITTSTVPAAAGPQSGQGRLLKGGRLKLPKAQFLISLPYDADIKTLKINILKDSPAQNAKSRISGARQAAPAQAPAGRELKATLELGAIPEGP